MMQLIGYYKSLGANITFACAANPGEHPTDLEALGVTCVRITLNHSSFDDFIKALDPKMVVFDRYMTEEQFGWRVAAHCPECIRILDTEDLHCLRAVRQQCVKDDQPLSDELLLGNALAKRELASIFRSDLSLIISQYEMDLLMNLYGVSPDLLCYLPLVVDTLRSTQTKWEMKKDFVFIGNFIHAPNWDAVLNLKHTIWPLIHQKLPGVKLHIYGAYASAKVNQLHNEQGGFLVHGWAESAAAVFESARVCLAPLRFGAGLKGKLLEAMHYGTPNLTSTIGAEGIQGELPWGGVVEDNWELFSNAAVQLYNDKVFWEQAQENGYDILRKRFDKQVHFDVFQSRLQRVLSQVEENRNKNFIGGMLMQQTTAASKYMAKWIAAKNNSKPLS